MVGLFKHCKQDKIIPPSAHLPGNHENDSIVSSSFYSVAAGTALGVPPLRLIHRSETSQPKPLGLTLRTTRGGHDGRIAIVTPSQDDIHRPSANMPLFSIDAR